MLMRVIAAPTIARELTLQYAVLMLPTERRSELSPWLALSSSSTNFPNLQFWFGPFAAEECLMMAVDPRGEGGRRMNCSDLSRFPTFGSVLNQKCMTMMSRERAGSARKTSSYGDKFVALIPSLQGAASA